MGTAGNLTISFGKNADVKLFSGFHDGEEILPLKTETQADGIRFYYQVNPGKYHCLAKCEGLYSWWENFCFTEEELEQGVQIVLPQECRTGEGFELDESMPVQCPSAKLWNKIMPDWDPSWEGYDFLWNTPVFSHSGHSFTTHEEMLTFIGKLEQQNPYMRQFPLFTSPVYGLKVPLVVFSTADLSEADTLEDAAAILRADGKPIVQYQAQIHGNEPMGGEGSLAMMNWLSMPEGQKLLEKINVYVIPRFNPDGAKDYNRNCPATGKDPNRDFLHLINHENRSVVSAYNLFMPEVVIDGHEFKHDMKCDTNDYPDMLFSCGLSLNNDPALRQKGVDLVHACFQAVGQKQLRYFYYLGHVYSANYARGAKYYGTKGTIPILVETHGSWFGRYKRQRRLMGQFTAARRILEIVAAEAETFRDAVARERLRLRQQVGKPFVLKSGYSKQGDGVVRSPIPQYVYDMATGEIVDDSDVYGYLLDVVEASRERPACYMLPLGEDWIPRVETQLQNHGISFYKTEPITELLQRYEGTCDKITLSEKQEVTFPKGALVIPVAQVSANLVSALLEPDFGDGAADAGSFAQWGLIPAENGGFPIYRK